MATRMGTGVGHATEAWQAGRDAALAAVRPLGGRRPDLVIAFASPRYDAQPALEGIRGVTAGAPLLGCSSAGAFTEAGFANQAVVVTVIASDAMTFVTGTGCGLKRDLRAAVGDAIAGFRGTTPASLERGLRHRAILLFADGLGGGGEALLEELTVRTALGYDIVGGAAGDDARFRSTPVFHDAEALIDAFVCVEILSPAPLGLGLSHGWRPMSPVMRVTRSEGNVVQEIDGRPALDVYRALARDRGVVLEGDRVIPFLMEHIIGWEYQPDDFKLRVTLWPLDDGSVVCASEIPRGALIRLMEATDRSVIDTAGAAFGTAARHAAAPALAGVLTLECVSQRLRVGERGVDAQIRRIQESVGAVPLAGCHGYGQFARLRGDFTGLMSASALVCAFPDA